MVAIHVDIVRIIGMLKTFSWLARFGLYKCTVLLQSTQRRIISICYFVHYKFKLLPNFLFVVHNRKCIDVVM